MCSITSEHITLSKCFSLKGIFTDGDLRRAIEKDKKNFLYQKMKDLMINNPRSIGKEALVMEAIKEMEKDPKKLINVLPVVENKKIIGIIRMHDIIQEGLKG